MCPPDGLTERQPQQDVARLDSAGPAPLRRGPAVHLPRFRAAPPLPTEALHRRAAAGEIVPRELPSPEGLPGDVAAAGAIEAFLRRDLLARLAELNPGLTESHREAVASCAQEALAAELRSARNQLAQAIPDLLRDVADAPCAAILAACGNVDPPAAKPLLRLLPLLAVEDLMALITAPETRTGRLVAARPTPSALDATTLAQAAASATARSLLASETTAVREATLDVLIAGERGPAELATPLIQCPALPLRIARALAGLALGQITELLEGCAALTPELTPEFRRMIRSRLQDRISGQMSQPLLEPSSGDAVQTAHRLKRAGALCAAVILAAARRGEARLVAALLAVAAGVPISAVNRAVSLRSAKGLLSLIWRAGLGMDIAGPVQTLLGRVPPDASLTAAPNGDFPITVEEMRWQIEFLTRVAR